MANEFKRDHRSTKTKPRPVRPKDAFNEETDEKVHNIVTNGLSKTADMVNNSKERVGRRRSCQHDGYHTVNYNR